MQNARVRVSTRGDVTLLKTFTFTKLSVRTVIPSHLRPRDRASYKESSVRLITEASNSSHFHIPLIFCALLSQPCSTRDFFSLLDSFSHLRNLFKKCVQCRVTIPQGQQHVSSAQQS